MIKHLKILVVDDDPAIAMLVAEYLQLKGYDVEYRTSGQAGLDVLKQTTVDLAICDIQMIGINGFEFLIEARKINPRMGIILMTGFEENYPLSEALKAGADGYISKPFTFDKFSLIFEKAYWNALSRQDWWENHDDGQLTSALS